MMPVDNSNHKQSVESSVVFAESKPGNSNRESFDSTKFSAEIQNSSQLMENTESLLNSP